MLDILKNIINRGENQKPIEFEFSGQIKFNLKIENLVIGYLTVEDSKWVFKYSEEFKTQDKYARLTGFSDLNKIYMSEVLWPFFKIRIPGLKQPMIKDIIRSEELDSENEVQLLRRFGEFSRSNPYVLKSEK